MLQAKDGPLSGGPDSEVRAFDRNVKGHLNTYVKAKKSANM